MINKYKKLLEKIPFAKEIGIELLEISEGYAKGKIQMENRHQNPYGGMHGGCIFALADTISGISACTYGNLVTTVDSSIHYLLPLSNTEYVICESKVVRQGGNIGVYNVNIYNDQDKLAATATFTYYKLEQTIEFN